MGRCGIGWGRGDMGDEDPVCETKSFKEWKRSGLGRAERSVGGFLAVIWFGSSPPPTPSPVIRLPLFLSRRSSLRTVGGGWGGGRGAEFYDRRKAWSSINHSILSGGDPDKQGFGSVFIFYGSGSGSRGSGWRPIRIRIRIRIQSGSRALMTKSWKKITADKKN